MAKQTFTVEATSLNEARKKAKSRVPEGLDIISEEILSDGKTRGVKGVADTIEGAFEKAQSDLPSDAEVIEKKQQIAPIRKVVTVEAFDEKNASEQVKRDIAKTARIESITLKKPGKRGLLGIGKKPNCYEVQVFEQAMVEIKYKKKAKIRVKLSESPESWAQKLSEKKDYRALAAIFNSQDYSEAFQKWAKERLAREILLKAGAEAVDAILEELATDGVGSDDLAELLVEIGDPKAVPLLKKKLDRGDFAGCVTTIDKIKEFIKKYPDRIGPVEMAKCLLCGKTRPVTQMRGCEEKKEQIVGFCARTCWRRRGLILGSKDGVGCPYYTKDRMCLPPVGTPSPCTFRFKIGPSFTACHVYRTYPRRVSR